MFENLDSSSIFEVAPSTNDGDLIWIHEIENPEAFFTGCDTPSDVLDQVIESEGVTEQIETCGYTLVLDRPEDPSPDRAGDPPDDPIVVEVTQGVAYNQRFSIMETEHEQGQGNEVWNQPIELFEESFYRIENPFEIFGDVWGNTTKMFQAIQDRGIDPVLKYDDVSFIFNRPYGSL